MNQSEKGFSVAQQLVGQMGGGGLFGEPGGQMGLGKSGSLSQGQLFVMIMFINTISHQWFFVR